MAVIRPLQRAETIGNAAHVFDNYSVTLTADWAPANELFTKLYLNKAR
jgi:hypothetical protein